MASCSSRGPAEPSKLSRVQSTDSLVGRGIECELLNLVDVLNIWIMYCFRFAVGAGEVAEAVQEAASRLQEFCALKSTF